MFSTSPATYVLQTVFLKAFTIGNFTNYTFLQIKPFLFGWLADCLALLRFTQEQEKTSKSRLSRPSESLGEHLCNSASLFPRDFPTSLGKSESKTFPQKVLIFWPPHLLWTGKSLSIFKWNWKEIYKYFKSGFFFNILNGSAV